MASAAGYRKRCEHADEQDGYADPEGDRVAIFVGSPLASSARRESLAATSAPIAPPIVRTIVFIPVATPVCPAGTASTIRFAIDAKAKPTPTPTSVAAR